MAKKSKRPVRLAESSQNPFALFRSEVSADSGVIVKENDVFDPDGGSETFEQRDLEDFSITSEVEAILNDTNIVARDMKIDDSSMEQAKSFWHWCTDSQFLGEHVSPYLEQALIGIKLFGEYCPSCSNVEWMQDENHKPQEGLNGIRKHVQPLEYGVCPKCGARRSEMIKNGELSFYNELAVNAGQRCVVEETRVVVTGGKFGEQVKDIPIRELLPDDYDDGTGFYNLPKGTQVYGHEGFQDTDRIFVSRTDELWEIKTQLGFELCGTREHPVWRESLEGEEGFCDLKDIRVGEKVMTSQGWSRVIHSAKSSRRERTYDLHVPTTHEYFTNSILSHNSGKSIVVALISTYITHRVLMMQKPTEIYRVGPNQMLHGAFVALTAGQAKDTLWEPYYGYILESPWFKKYHALLDFYQQKYKQTIYKVMDSYILYRHRNLFVHYAGPDKRVLRGRCLTGDTMVNTTGGFLEFGEFIKTDGFTESDITIDSHRGNRKVSHLYKDESETYKLKTANGFSVEGTPEHPMLVMTDRLAFKWKRLDEIKTGDWVVSRTKHNAPMFGNSNLTKDEATLLAYYIANGNRNEISSNDPSVTKNLIKVAKHITGKTPTRSSNDPTVRADIYYIKSSSYGNNFQSWLKSFGLESTNSSDKYIPKIVRTAPKEILHEFLESYFECDSGINGGTTASSTHEAPIEVEVGSASEKLTKQLHTILFHGYGILGRMSKQVFYDKLNPKTGKFDAERVHYLISITGYDAWLFFQTFKRAKVQKYKERSWFVEKGYASDRRNIPYIREYLFNLIEDARVVDLGGKRLRRLKCEDGTEILNSKKPNCIKHLRGKCTSHTASEYLVYSDDWDELLSIYDKVNFKKSEKLRKFIDREAHFEEVVSCEKQDGNKVVYDVTVPKGHAFTANCLASHNTRIFACVGEDELVSTDRGLVKMQDIEDGMIANIGHRTGSIRNHTMTGEKEVKKLVLESGQELLATDLHKICVVRDDKFKKVKIKNLRVTDKVCVGLGGQYPDSLELPTYNVDQCLFDTVVDVFMTNAMVDYELLESVTGSPRNPLTAFVSKLVKSGAVEKHYRKGKMVVGMSRCYFTIADSDILQTFYTDTRSLKFPTQMTPELAEFIGMLLADGNLRDSKQKGVWFGSTHRDRIERFTKLSYDLFGWKNHITTDRREDKDFWKSTLCNRHVISYLRTLGLDVVYSADKEIPWCILQAPKDSVRACIKAMYMCDGSVSYGQVRYSSTSKRMLLQLQQMLLREGYPTKLRDCQVSEDSCRKYTYTTNKYGDDRTIVTRMLVADSAVSWSMRTLTGRKPKRVSCKVHYFEKSRRKNIVLTSIKGVEETSKKMKVYDMTVDHKRHAYQASGMLVSNSIDEIGWFDNSKDSGKVKVDASEVYIALERSLLTCRSAEEFQLGLDYDQCFSAYFLNISSPSSVRDKICELVRLSEGSTKLLGLHKPTWEMNPNVPQDSPIIIEAYRKDPVTAERDYGANPPLSSNPFIRSRSMVMDCMKEKGRNFIKYNQQIYRAKDGGKYRYGSVQKIKQSTQPSIMAIDAGLTNNSFAMVVGTKDDANINLDLLIEIMPLPGIPLHYTMIYEHLILPVIEARNVRVLLADRWNSVKLLQDAEAESERLKVSKSYSVKYSDLWNTKASIESGRMRYPRAEEQDVDKILGFDPDDYPRCFTGKEAEHLILQMLTVQDTGKQVIKGENLTDDIWRAAVLLEWGLNNPDFDEHMVIDEGNKYKAGVIGVSRRGLLTSSNSGKIRTQGTKFLSVRSSRK